MDRRSFIALAGATALSTTLPRMAHAADATKITLWHAMGGRLGEVVNEIATRFNADQSASMLEPAYKGSYEDTLTSVIAAFRAGEHPNIAQVFDAGAATIIGAPGAVAAAEDLLAETGVAFDPNDYIDGVRYFYANSGGKMIGMPFNSSTPILYYNEDALKKAGVTPPKTWEEFQEIAPKLKEAGYVPLAQSHLPWIFTENFFSRHNLQFATNNNGFDGAEGTKLLINTPEIKMHFARVKEWLDAGLFGFYGTGWNDNQAAFETGKAAMWLGSSGSFGGLLKSTNFPFSATFLPYWKEITEQPYSTFIGGAALFALSGKPAEENRATAEFFKYLSSPEIQYYWHKETGYVPITKAAYEMARQDGHYERFPAAEIGILQLNERAGEWTRGYRLGYYVQIRDVMNREYGRIFSGETDVDTAFATIESEANALLDRFARTTG